MELKEFISSGILESYILGTATAEEIRLVREMEDRYPEVQKEIEDIEESLLNYAEADSEEPSLGLKEKIQSQMFEEKEKPSKGKIVNISSLNNSSKTLKYVIAASLGLLIGVSAILFSLYGKLEASQKKVAQLENENDILANEMGKQQQELKAKSNTLAVMMKPGSKMVMLKGMDISPESSAMVVYNINSKAVFLDAVSLPVPPMGKQYQLWAMVDGKPVDAGVFDVTPDGFVITKMRDMADVQAFAVTLEDAGGRPEPTMSAMYLMGNVTQNS